MDQEEYAFVCPHCWENISVMLDLSIDEQSFIEDCEVCCRPIRIHYEVEEGAAAAFSAEPGD